MQGMVTGTLGKRLPFSGLGVRVPLPPQSN